MNETRVGLVGCVKQKRSVPSRAADLYVSALFLGRRRYVERHRGRWFVLSAKYGLVEPDSVIEPYDVTLNDLSSAQRRAWSRETLVDLTTRLGDLTRFTFEIHAGARYLNYGLADGLRGAGAIVETPVTHLRIGQQLAFYAATG